MTGISTVGQALANIEQIKELQFKYSSLTTQLNTGRKTQVFSGLGQDVMTTQRSRTDVTQIEIFQTNISNTTSRTGLMLNAIEEFQAQTEIFEELLFGLSQESLHQKGAEVYAPVDLTTTVDLSATAGPGALTALIAANAPNLDPPNDQFTITFEDTVGTKPREAVVIDISDAEAAAGGGNAQIELLSYINTQLAAGATSYDAIAVADPLGSGGIVISGRGNITIDAGAANGMGTAGLAALGLTQGTTPVTENHIVGYTDGTIDANLENIKRLSSKVHDFLTDLLNVRQGERYLLGGADTTNPPVSNTGILDTSISVLLDNWKTGTIPTTADFISDLQDRDPVDDNNPDALSDTIVGYNAVLSSGNVGNVTVRVNERSEIDYTVLANEQGFRDILVATAVFKNDDLYPLGDVYADPYSPGDPVLNDADGNPQNGVPGDSIEDQRNNFFALLSATRTMVTNALENINEFKFQLENTRARMQEIKNSNREQKEILENIVADKELIDINLIAVQVNTLQISLEASYSVTAQTRQLSLVNFL